MRRRAPHLVAGVTLSIALVACTPIQQPPPLSLAEAAEHSADCELDLTRDPVAGAMYREHRVYRVELPELQLAAVSIWRKGVLDETEIQYWPESLLRRLDRKHVCERISLKSGEKAEDTRFRGIMNIYAFRLSNKLNYAEIYPDLFARGSRPEQLLRVNAGAYLVTYGTWRDDVGFRTFVAERADIDENRLILMFPRNTREYMILVPVTNAETPSDCLPGTVCHSSKV